MKKLSTLLLALCANVSIAQVVSTNPAIPRPDQPVTITFDVTGTDFASKNLNDVWLWTWIEGCPSNCDAPTNVDPATSAQAAAKVTRSTVNPNLYSITLTATEFFNKPSAEIQNVGVILKGRNWSDGKTPNRYITFSHEFAITFTQPSDDLFFVDSSQEIDIEVYANEEANITLKVNNAVVASSAAATTLQYTHIVAETSGEGSVVAEADNGSEVKIVAFTYVVRTAPVEESRPAGIIDGINYHTDPSKVTLALWAPDKTSVYVLGDFNDWKISPDYQMKKDGEHFWLEIGGLTAGEEYAYQYLVDETIRIADPYADKILDPNDQWIPSTIYPGLRSYPSEALSDEADFNRVAVLQTGQEPYAWQTTGYQKPTREKLVIYELLVRDFFSEQERSYQNLIDTIQYFKRLGVNAIELMPIMEFNGNDSWGYNPTFMFAPDKAYGTRDKLKEFIDVCHENGIAVILDIALNHQDRPNPYVMMAYDAAAGKPTPSNKWFNVDARHPYNVFYDMNHESPYTQAYVDTVTHYWLHEFKVDGFRFDLTKGFTQNDRCAGSQSNESCFGQRDDSRIAILKRMGDKIWSHSPDAYLILEHFAENSEEKELAEHGFMLWGNLSHGYNENTMGYPNTSDIGWIYHGTRQWTVPHVVGYIESHDEERLMYKNIQYGRNESGYNTRSLSVALERMKTAATIFYTIPGPKMLWQFGELGYDYSINHCSDGSNSNECRVSTKPVRWDYREEEQRYALYTHISDLNRLRSQHDIFTHGTATLDAGNTLTKQLMLKNDPYTANPASTADMNAVVVVNFDVTIKSIATNFPHSGTWYDYYDDHRALQITGTTMNVSLPPGGYKLYTDYPIESPVTDAEESLEGNGISLYPSPADRHLIVKKEGAVIERLTFISTTGGRSVPIRLEDDLWDISGLTVGLYIVEIQVRNGIYKKKFVKY